MVSLVQNQRSTLIEFSSGGEKGKARNTANFMKPSQKARCCELTGRVVEHSDMALSSLLLIGI